MATATASPSKPAAATNNTAPAPVAAAAAATSSKGDAAADKEESKGNKPAGKKRKAAPSAKKPKDVFSKEKKAFRDGVMAQMDPFLNDFLSQVMGDKKSAGPRSVYQVFMTERSKEIAETNPELKKKTCRDQAGQEWKDIKDDDKKRAVWDQKFEALKGKSPNDSADEGNEDGSEDEEEEERPAKKAKKSKSKSKSKAKKAKKSE